eukprot:UN33182
MNQHPELELKLSDIRMKKIGFTTELIEKIRLNSSYEENTWQKTLYDMKYGSYVLTFEECEIESFEEILEFEPDDIQKTLSIPYIKAKKFCNN